MPDDTPTSYRCSICGNNYPPRPDYEVCPVDKERTYPMRRQEPMTDEEAHSILAHAQFEDFLEEKGML